MDRPPRPSERVDEACDRFEAAWSAGPPPRIEDYLAAADGPDHPVMLRELVALERELRLRRGERPEAREYLERFPADADAVQAAFGDGPRPGARSVPAPEGEPGRNLLFGVLALQNGFIGSDDLVWAFAAWTADRARPLASVLAERGALDAVRHSLLEALVAEQLKQHDGDTEASLAAVSSLGPVRRDLERLGDSGLLASLEGTAIQRFGPDPEGRDGAGDGATAADPTRRAGARFRILRFHRQGGVGAGLRRPR
jgi:hypothetical protein